IPSHSMENTLLPGDYIVVNKLAYALRDVRRGDVVIFHHQADTSMVRETYVKRVIGLASDTVTLTHEGVWVNGRPLPDPPECKLPADPVLASQRSPVEIIVGRDSLFVLGDNRRNSFDSRYWGCLPTAAVIGTPLFIYWSRGGSTDNPLPHIRWDRVLSSVK
ncbi:MAG: signal peptidase I, partial [Bacteroidota bacterium]